MGLDNPRFFLTAYGIALKHGFKGTEAEWLTSLTAYGMAVAMGFEGTEEEWLQKLNDPVPALTIGEVVTLPGGSMATVSIGGTKDAPILNFGIPRGQGMVDAVPIVGGTMKGNLNMGGFLLIGLPEPSRRDEAVNKEYADKIKQIAENAVKREGDKLQGNLDMAGFRVLQLPEPVDAGEAVNKDYADRSVKKTGDTMTGNLTVPDPTENGHAANLGYVTRFVDGKYLAAQINLPASGWSSAAPYTQAVAVAGILATDRPHYGVVYASDTETAIAQKEAFALVDDLDTAAGSVTFTCFEDKPGVDLTIQLEVNR